MKNLKLLLILAATITLTFLSCKKDEEDGANTGTSIYDHVYTTVSSGDMGVSRIIISGDGSENITITYIDDFQSSLWELTFDATGTFTGLTLNFSGTGRTDGSLEGYITFSDETLTSYTGHVDVWSDDDQVTYNDDLVGEYTSGDFSLN